VATAQRVIVRQPALWRQALKELDQPQLDLKGLGDARQQAPLGLVPNLPRMAVDLARETPQWRLLKCNESVAGKGSRCVRSSDGQGGWDSRRGSGSEPRMPIMFGVGIPFMISCRMAFRSEY